MSRDKIFKVLNLVTIISFTAGYSYSQSQNTDLHEAAIMTPNIKALLEKTFAYLTIS